VDRSGGQKKQSLGQWGKLFMQNDFSNSFGGGSTPWFSGNNAGDTLGLKRFTNAFRLKRLPRTFRAFKRDKKPSAEPFALFSFT
jgi:hypothetical protein